jgi:DedD protein
MAIQATSEEQLRLKKRARQRLLGAAALLLTAAIVLPLVLDNSPRVSDTPVHIDMVGAPSLAAVAPAVASSPPVTSDATPVQVAEVPNLPAPSVAPQAAPVVVKESAKAVEPLPEKPKTKPAVLDAEPKKTELKKPEPKKLEPKPVQVTEPKPVVKVEPKKTEPKPVLADTNEHSNQHFVVQLGAFSNADNVQQLRNRLSAVGVATYTEKLPSGATRVRVGPYSDKALAEKTLEKINAAGVQAQIVALK